MELSLKLTNSVLQKELVEHFHNATNNEAASPIPLLKNYIYQQNLEEMERNEKNRKRIEEEEEENEGNNDSKRVYPNKEVYEDKSSTNVLFKHHSNRDDRVLNGHNEQEEEKQVEIIQIQTIKKNEVTPKLTKRNPPFSLVFTLNSLLSMFIQVSFQYYFLTVKERYILDVYKGMAILSLLLPILFLIYYCFINPLNCCKRVSS